jgi:lysine 2,3-aminomutase
MMPSAMPSRPPATGRRAADLVAAGVLAAEEEAAVAALSEEFALAVTPEMLALMVPGDPEDPIYRQFVPAAEERVARPEERADPIGDGAHSPLKGIVHRYPDRVLLTPVHVCPVYCRFCFRRERVGPGGEDLSPAELAAALGYVRRRPEIWEVIVTGGDPLVLSPRRLAAIVEALVAIDHVEVIRFHSRVPVVDPRRVSAEMVAALRAPKAVYVVLHSNHARELTPEALAACARLIDAGIPMLCQTVLLRGVNDDPESLRDLFRALVRARIKPYYLHHGDLARGTGHLRTTIARGQALMRSLRGRLSGLCQPTYVLDLPGGHGKVPIGPTYLRPDVRGRYLVEDVDGRRHAYPPVPDAAG